MKELNIVEYSAASNKQAASKLKYHGNQTARVVLAVRELHKEFKPDIISVRDVSYDAVNRIEAELSWYNYKMVIHPSWYTDVKDKDRYRYTCLSAVFIKTNIDYKQIYGDETYPTVLRSVCIEFSLADKTIIYKTSHIPCVDDERASGIARMIQRKESMLKAEIEFQKDNNNCYALSSGDFNGSKKEACSCYCQEYYADFVFTDLITEPTFESNYLDHVFISKALKESDISVTAATVLDKYYGQLTDHRIIHVKLAG